METIKCIGRRTIVVEKMDKTISLAIYWKGDRRIATLQLEKNEALKLVGELNGLIRPFTST